MYGISRFVAFLTVILGIHLSIDAQDTSKYTAFPGTVVTVYSPQNYSESSLNIRGIPVDSLGGGGNYTLTDLLARTPGVSMLSTGPGISKPVIRGLYGNRVLVLLNGLKFDNQQWQEEHGLGLGDAGLSRVEIIKGPMGILYGSEAIGGVVNLIDEGKADKGKTETDYRVKLFSNTLGMDFNFGIKTNKGNKWYGVRVSGNNHADYFDGSNARVLNSRMDGYLLKAHLGFRRKNWVCENRFISSFNRFGFIFNDIYTFVDEDARYNRSLNVNPAHLVLLNVLNSENKIILSKRQSLTFNVGVQSNRRMENEGGGAISLDMHLLTGQYQLKWKNTINKNNELVFSGSSCLEDNTNYGARKIVPDARMAEHLVSGFWEHRAGKRLILENGAGVGTKEVKTFFTPMVNGPDKEIKPFDKHSFFYNALSGFSYKIDSGSYIKANVASGVRVANLAELSSDGLHEGVFTYEIGNPNLKNEQNLAVNVELAINEKYWSFGFSPFVNYFRNYIFLAPTTEDWLGFPVFRYRQTNAFQRGMEAQVSLKPGLNWQIDAAVSGMMSTTDDGLYTPYTPANKLSLSVQKSLNILNGPIILRAGADFYRRQNQLYTAEKGTPAYHLFDFSARGKMGMQKQIDWQITVNNIANATYYDHLSRFKYFGLYNMGRNCVVSLKWHFIRDRK